MKREPGVNGEWLTIPFKMRVKALEPLWSRLLFICLLWFIPTLAYISLEPRLWGLIILFAFGGVFVITFLTLLYVSPVLLKWRTWKWSESAEKIMVEKKRVEAQKGMRRRDTIQRCLSHPISRFIFALGILCASWWIAPIDKPNPQWKEWFLVAVGILYAAYLLRETLLIFVAIAVISLLGYLAYVYVESLSITGAIIVGAIIIAVAIYNSGNRNRAN